MARADLGTEHIQTDERRALRAQVFACPDKINIVPAFVQRAFEHGKLGLHAPVQQRHHAFGLQRKVHVNARRFANAISYGPGETDQPRPVWAGAPHGADEAMEMAQLYKALRIYILAIARLMKLEL